MAWTSAGARNVIVGSGLVAVGAILALDRLGLVSLAQVLRLWPLALIALGAGMIARAAGTSGDGQGERS